MEHAYFYAVPVVDDATRQGYLRQAYTLGKEFAKPRPVTPCAAFILGCIRVGEISTYELFPDGRLWATVIFYKEL